MTDRAPTGPTTGPARAAATPAAGAVDRAHEVRAAAADHRFGPGTEVLGTERLLLRRWREDDLAPFAAMNADPEVMRHFPAPLDRSASDALARYADVGFDVVGHGLAAVEERATGRFLGFVGLARHRRRPRDVEIGWRLDRAAWGRGLATEAARAWVDAAAGPLALPRLISITTAGNLRSLAVMHRLGFAEVERERWEGIDDEVVVTARDLTGDHTDGHTGGAPGAGR